MYTLLTFWKNDYLFYIVRTRKTISRTVVKNHQGKWKIGHWLCIFESIKMPRLVGFFKLFFVCDLLRYAVRGDYATNDTSIPIWSTGIRNALMKHKELGVFFMLMWCRVLHYQLLDSSLQYPSISAFFRLLPQLLWPLNNWLFWT